MLIWGTIAAYPSRRKILFGSACLNFGRPTGVCKSVRLFSRHQRSPSAELLRLKPSPTKGLRTQDAKSGPKKGSYSRNLIKVMT